MLCIRGVGNDLLLRSELRSDLEIVAKLRLDALNLLGNTFLRLSQETFRSGLGETGHTVVMDNNLSAD